LRLVKLIFLVRFAVYKKKKSKIRILLVRKRKYVLDLSDLQYKQVRLHWSAKFLRIFLWLAVSVIITVFYITVFEKVFGSPRERILSQQVENMKLQYSLISRELDNSLASINSIRLSDDKRYRPVLNMESVPESFRKAGYGGVDRFRDLAGYENSDLIISYRSKIEDIKNMAIVQNESFKSIAERTAEWKREMDHQPVISPVDVKFRLGDNFGFRDIHPVLGTPRMHYGQDFPVPTGTEVYATGDGTVIESGWSSNGFGNSIVIDHGYGLQSTYGHLSDIKVVMGMNVKRGDLIGLSGSSGISSGPHLHYQIEQFGEHKNPVNFFNNDLSEEEYNEMIQAFESKSKFR
jgi:murein DD-endopeptidase MepM/ murein hydrolase activator NlpD